MDTFYIYWDKNNDMHIYRYIFCTSKIEQDNIASRYLRIIDSYGVTHLDGFVFCRKGIYEECINEKIEKTIIVS